VDLPFYFNALQLATSIRRTRKANGRLSTRHEGAIARPDKLSPLSICPGCGGGF
jgi:hypothetical protein